MQTEARLAIDGDVATITFASAAGKPATLNHAVLEQLAACLDEIETKRETLRAVVIRSNAEKYFIVGADIRALQTLDEATIVSWVRHGHAVFDRLEALPLPVIAVVEGYALGGGLELAMACDLILASHSARFGQPEARLGFVAGWGGSYRLPRRVGLGRARELLFTGRIIDAARAGEIGLVDFMGTQAEVAAYREELLADIRAGSATAVGLMKQLINQSMTASNRENQLAEADASSTCLADEETQRRVAAFLQKNRTDK